METAKKNSNKTIAPEAMLSDDENRVANSPAIAVAQQEWRSYIDPLLSAGERLFAQMLEPNDPLLRREFYRGLFSQLSTAYLSVLYADPQHPDLVPYQNIAYNFAGPNPDNVYYITPVEDTGVYKITGFRGTVKRVDLGTGTGTWFPRGVMDENKLGLTLANYDLDSIPHNQDGSFEVILSAARPDGYAGNWLQLHKKVTYLYIRQISYDWVNEVDGRFAIERLDRAAIKPRSTVARLEEDLQQVAKWLEGTIQLCISFASAVRKIGVNTRIDYFDISQYGEIRTQQYAYGAFDLGPDEALIVEAKVPNESRYWSIHLLDDYVFALDWMHRQTILNGHTARIDQDGVFRAVISAQDPGVPNWLDTAGHRTGTIQIRWEMCDIYPDHKVTKVKTSEIRRQLPEDTPVVTAEEREQTIRLRRAALQMRRRW